MNKLQTKIANTDTEMLLITATNLDHAELKEASARMVRAEINEELARRFPETQPALDAWSEDLDSELTMLEVILANMTDRSFDKAVA
jgi:hypothetical protein